MGLGSSRETGNARMTVKRWEGAWTVLAIILWAAIINVMLWLLSLPHIAISMCG
jgi:hypothetical protein